MAGVALVLDYPAAADDAACLEWARQAVRGIERFAYRQVSHSTGDQARMAENLRRTTVGLRRMLDRWDLGGD